jgi:ubiquinone/menaquinone biosynthesis C-methylase UbiE
LTDATYIRDVQYKNDRNLAARQSLYRFQQPPQPIWTLAIDLAELRGDEPVLEVGCGNGGYLGVLHQRAHRGVVCGLDLAPGMLPAAHERAPDASLMIGDATRLPFRDDSIGCVLAMHMLYHVPDRAAAISELRRVLRREGVALVLTNGLQHLAELDDLVAAATQEVLGREVRPMQRGQERFNVEGAPAQLEPFFDAVELHEMNSELLITEIEPLLAYVRSMRTVLTQPDPAIGEAVVDAVARRARARLEAEGVVRARTVVGCFVCR